MEELFDGFDIDYSVKDKDLAPINCIVLESNVVKDEYTRYVEEAFDLEVGEKNVVEIPNKLFLDNMGDWNIGVVCGSSGSGKTTILKHLGNGDIDDATFDNSKGVISNFTNLTPKEATHLCSSMGLCEVRAWIRPFKALSNGQQYRAKLAKIVNDSKSEIILVDEFTSVVDRDVAKAMSNALQKYIRNNNKKIILATCHYDIFEWLRPDWIYDLNKGGALEKCDYLRQPKPKIHLQVFRTTCDTWERFKKYHYMSENLNKSSSSFVFTWNDKVVAYYSAMQMPSGTIKNAWRGHRCVVLPDFQGLGIGSKISEFIGGILLSVGRTLYTKTVNPALGEYRQKSDKWKGTPRNMKGMSEEDFLMNKLGGKTRVSYCHKYVGEPIYGFEHLLKKMDDLVEDKNNENQLTLL